MKTRDIVRQWVVVLAIVFTIIMNGLANALPLNGQGTGEISDRFKVFFVPAGYVFAIWGIIYIGLLAYAIFQALPAQRGNPRLRATGYWVVLSCIANVTWLFLWHYNLFALTMLAMLALLIFLIVIYEKLGIGRLKVSRGERWAVQIPFSIYLGWVSVATIANASDVLYDIQWNGFGISPQVWAVILLVIAVILGALMAWRRGDVAYLLVFVWAFAGIGVKQAGAPLVSYTAWIAALVALGLAILAFWRYPRLVKTAGSDQV